MPRNARATTPPADQTPAVESDEAAARLRATKARAARTPKDLALASWPSIAPRPYAEQDGALPPDESAQRGRETRGPDGSRLLSPNGPGPDAYDVGTR
jgi:hypothetical protein